MTTTGDYWVTGDNLIEATRPSAGSTTPARSALLAWPGPVPPDSTTGTGSEPLAISSSMVKALPPKRRIVTGSAWRGRRAADGDARAVGRPGRR